VGNLTLGTTLWTIADEATGNYLGWAAYLSLPTGQKRAEGFFASEDRYALDLEGGTITKLANKASLDLIGQAEFYTRDRTSDVSRKPLLRAFAHLSYHLSDATRLAFSVRQSYGTRERLNGATVGGPRNDTNLMLTWAQQVTETLQLQLQYAQDVKVRNGAAVKGFQARAAFVF
jgi:Putative MetA-pathway of phenol degradation